MSWGKGLGSSLFNGVVAFAVTGGLKAAGISWFWAGVLAVTGVIVGNALVGFLRAVSVQSIYYKWRVATWSGISRVYPVAEYPRQGADPSPSPKQLAAVNASLAELAKSAEKLQLLLASGWYHVGCGKHKGVLYDALHQRGPGQQLEVLLLAPELSGERADRAGVERTQYAEGIRAVVWTLRQLARQCSTSVEVRFYPEAPIWQMVLTEQELWLWCATEVRSERSPAYCLRRDAEYGLAWGLHAVWERRWYSGEPVDLEAAEEPNWEQLKSVLDV